MTMRFIVVDGLDGCGKDTHALRIKSAIEGGGGSAEIVSHPSARLWGRLSRKALQGSGQSARIFATLFFTMDVLASVRRMKRRRRSEETLIFVRYLLGTAYLPERLAPLGYLLFRNLLPFPDLALFIDIDPEVAERRIAARGHAKEMFETRERLASVRRVAKRLTAREWVVVDNSEDGEPPFQEVERILTERSMLGLAAER